MRAAVLLLILAPGVGCAARIPPETTFDPEAWKALRAVPAQTEVDVDYVTGTPPLRHDFRGSIDRISTEWLEMTTADGRQRLLPNRVLRVTRITDVRVEDSLLEGAVIGGVFCTLLLAPMAKAIEETDVTEAHHVLPPAIVGALIGAFIDYVLKGRHREEIYNRRRK